MIHTLGAGSPVLCSCLIEIAGLTQAISDVHEIRTTALRIAASSDHLLGLNPSSLNFW